MKKLFILMFLSICLACSTLKKSSLEKTGATTLNGSTAQKIKWQQNSVQHDSVQSIWAIEIVPKGKFSYSMANGFEGEAVKMSIKNKRLTVSDLKQAEELLGETKKIANAKIELNEKFKNKQKSSPSFWLWIIMFLALAATACYFWRRWKV